MDVPHPKCCGLDVHKSSISACILLREAGRMQKHQRRFGAMTQYLHELAEWLRQFGVTQVATHCSKNAWRSSADKDRSCRKQLLAGTRYRGSIEWQRGLFKPK
jgi:transposase